jgi:hypothetical protein
MNTAINLIKSSDIHRFGTEALIKALGPMGMARYLEEYDNGGTGDYTKEKYIQPELTIEDIRKM